tara:strand:- start:422 stop:619 length:198 start_codon:yes stop_codon:yes gene_type:complete
MDDTLKLTTVKILKRLYADFKHKSLDNNFTLQKLVNRSIHLYNTDVEYQQKIENANLVKTGSYHL